MKELTRLSLLICTILLSLGCSQKADIDENDTDSEIEKQSDSDTFTDSDSFNDSETDVSKMPKYSKVDLLVVMDNSNSMEEEQILFSKAVNSLIGNLAKTDLRVALVSTDMGFSAGGNPFDIQTSAFPSELVNEKCADPMGDKGLFYSSYSDGISGDISCPPSPSDNELKYFSSDSGYWPLSDLAAGTSCLSQIGVDGCGWEQPLMSAATALTTPSQASFIRADSLTVIIVISDEEDCSLKNDDIFSSDEVQDNDYININIACGENPDSLYSTAEILKMYTDAKVAITGEAGKLDILFAAITGVPQKEECEGTGNDISKCLSQPEMQNTIITRSASTDGPSYYDFACRRDADDGGGPITGAVPGRRYVDIAERLGPMGYIYSICNSDWTPAAEALTDMITSRLE